MALVSVQRSPSPSLDESDNEFDCRSELSSPQARPSSESYFTVKGAAVILSHSDQAPRHRRSCSEDKDIERDLQSMLRLIRQQDTMSRVVRLQSCADNITRYLAVVENSSTSQGGKNFALFGFDQIDGAKTSIGLVVPIVCSTSIRLDGDGGIAVESLTELYFFKPVSIQAMWSVFQYVHKELATIQRLKHSNFEDWRTEYSSHMTTDDSVRGLWYMSLLEDAMVGDVKPTGHQAALLERSSKELEIEALIRRHLRQIMQSVDLDEVTSSDIRKKLEEQVGYSLKSHKEFIDREMLVIMGQLDEPSKIFDYLYLGTEWNASNWEELKANKVGYILNMTKEVDNFYPNHFTYKKIWVSDEASTELLKHWQKTYEFIKHAKDSGSTVLVHCKKGISRSSSTVIAYTMKEYGWSLQKALNYVKEKRNCITPNTGFMEQLMTFDGVLQASSNRHSAVFNPIGSHFDACSIDSAAGNTTQSSVEVTTLAKLEELMPEQVNGRPVTSHHSKSARLTPQSPRLVRHQATHHDSAPTTSKTDDFVVSRTPKICNGKVRQHREKFERVLSRNTFQTGPSNNFKHRSHSHRCEESRNVRSLVDVFEKPTTGCSRDDDSLFRNTYDMPSHHNESLITSMT